ncbi:MAG: hypothetical protein SYC29_18280 [Planctomycetota bacterium]|nr:hypothetical protein [Planctomycetota bacterium]
MTAGTGDNLTSPPQRRRRFLAGRLRLGMVLSILCLTIIGAVAIVLAADYVLFVHGTRDEWRLRGVPANYDDLEWWKAHVGPLPPRGTTEGHVAPMRPVGPDGWNRGGCGGPPGMILPKGLVAYRMKTAWPMIRGDLLTSKTTHAWRVGVDLPGGRVIERMHIGPPGVRPPHPAFGGWECRILPLGLVLNSLYVAGPLCIVVTILVWEVTRVYRGIRGATRGARGRCPQCGYVLVAGQSVSPECGYHEKRTYARCL